jgi:hypothetical protein
LTDKTCQKINAGTEPTGLHIENSNGPFPLSLIIFYNIKITKQGFQKMVCDGTEPF